MSAGAVIGLLMIGLGLFGGQANQPTSGWALAIGISFLVASIV